MPTLLEGTLTHSVIGAFFDVYNALGYGFLEHVYVQALEYELRARGYRVGREVAVSISYRGQVLASQRLDMVIDEKLIVEVKSTHDLPKAASRQLFNYLRATKLEVGLLLHFGPEPKFYRLTAPNTPQQRSPHKIDPSNPSSSEAS